MCRTLFILLTLSYALTTFAFGRCQVVWHDAPAAAAADAYVAQHCDAHAGLHAVWPLDTHSHDPDTPPHTHLPQDDASRKAPRLTAGSADLPAALTAFPPCEWTMHHANAAVFVRQPPVASFPPRDPPLSGRTSHLLF